MEEAIKSFHKQFSWNPEIVNGEKLPKKSKFVLGGMGGSHLSAGLLLAYDPSVNLLIHRDYGIPKLDDAPERLFIASSYSGNTEESIDFAEKALSEGYAVATISVGGKLLDFAQKNGLPHIVIPNTKIQPRSALGFSMIALAKLLGKEDFLTELASLASKLSPEELQGKGEMLSRTLRNSVPVIYASARNAAVAYNWKIKMNETGKIPAFYNVFPELNHNEMTGFDLTGTTEGLSRRFHFVFLADAADHPKNQRRMQVCRKLYEDRGLPVTEVPLLGDSTLEKIFSSLLVADWTALHLSKIYGTEAEQVPMVEEFKRLVSS